MSNQNRRSSFSSSTTSSLAKRHASSSSSENVGKPTSLPPHLAKKRAPLANLTNLKNVPHAASRNSLPSSTLVPGATKIAKTNKEPTSSNVKSSAVVFPEVSSFTQKDEAVPTVAAFTVPVSTNFNAKSSAIDFPKFAPVPQKFEAAPSVSNSSVPLASSMDVSPCKSDGMSVSLDETMSTCDSFNSPEVEYMDNNDVSAVDSIGRKTLDILNISDNTDRTIGNICNRDILVELEREDKIVNIDNNYVDPQLCATFACDIYKHLRVSEAKKRPSTDYMERVQKDINPSMRAILIDWLVEVAEEYRLVPDTLYLTVNYIDRYLSGNAMNRQKLQLLGVACMMIASKYEEICAPQVEEFCYITDNTYFKEEVLQMESAVLNFLKFEMTAPTTKCFLRRFVRAAQGVNEVPSLQLDCLANYLAELSLLEYSMLCYAPSLIAASAIFLAKYLLFPSTKPWNSTLQHYTLYQPSDLCDCVRDLHRLCCNTHTSNLPAIREKYSQHKYKYVAKKYIRPSIPQEFFQS
ncbi:cyclin-A1-4-like isoform X2 [Prosopis cineraria]|uniref:cyclin-A1-4-like isoform X2 n=1 Tax=Prosopis cineraria TaxID=364024 RepID=UPI00240F0B1B|nr:cyclin-A1-4-like isoform X2 [Prosopis cineraria]